jgi:hypothetical protein
MLLIVHEDPLFMNDFVQTLIRVILSACTPDGLCVIQSTVICVTELEDTLE